MAELAVRESVTLAPGRAERARVARAFVGGALVTRAGMWPVCW